MSTERDSEHRAEQQSKTEQSRAEQSKSGKSRSGGAISEQTTLSAKRKRGSAGSPVPMARHDARREPKIATAADEAPAH